MSLLGGAHVEIVDARAGDKGPLVPTNVLINGVDVGFVASDGVKIDVGGGSSITEVTVRLYPARVTIRGAKDEAEGP